jgi:hypothetical protein
VVADLFSQALSVYICRVLCSYRHNRPDYPIGLISKSMHFPVRHTHASNLWFGFCPILLLLAACTPAIPASEPLIRVQYSFAFQPWLTSLNDCATENTLDLELRSANLQNTEIADLVFRLGQSDDLASPSYLIDTEDLLVIVNPRNPIRKLTADQVYALFTGQILTWEPVGGSNSPVKVWIYPPGEDIQQVFTKYVLEGTPPASLARMANSPVEMSQAVGLDIDAIGYITRSWMTENVAEAFLITSDLPILAITKSEPQGALSQILSCLQK